MLNHSKWHISGNLISRDMRYWVPLISVHTGMRIGEICQLYVDDIQEIDNIWCISVDENGEQSVKSSAAIRKIPIHSNLLNEWGFKDWFLERKRKAKPKDTLFQEVSGKTKGQFATAISRWFNQFLQKHELKRDDLVFHSFRHTFIDLLRNSGAEEAIIQVIVGHANKSVTSRYGAGHRLVTLQSAIEKIDMPFDVPATTAKAVENKN